MILPRAKKRKGQAAGGFALVLSLILVTVIAGLCAGFVQLAAATSRTQSASVDQLRAFYLAEAGLAEAFLSVRMGRTGQIGSDEIPAEFGDGRVFVDAVKTTDARIWLRATATVRGGRAVLGLIVLPERPPLGFFATEELIIESTVHADGFDSSERSYDEEIAAVHLTDLEPPPPGDAGFVEDPNSEHYFAQTEASYFAGLVGGDVLMEYLTTQVEYFGDSLLSPILGYVWLVTDAPISFQDRMSMEDFNRFIDAIDDFWPAMQDCALVRVLEEAPEHGGAVEPSSEEPAIEGAAEGASEGAAKEDAPLLTERGAALGSNGNVTFLDPGSSAIRGSVTPGVDGEVIGLPPELVSGSTQPRALTVDPDPVEIPDLIATTSLTHSGLIPHVVGEGSTGFDVLRVTDGAELIIRGPATIRVHELALDGGARLTLDTRDGNVELFVTGSLAMDPASFVDTTGSSSKEVSILAGAVEGGESPPLDLDARSQFHGTVYAPGSDVRVGSNFEVFGSVVGRRLEIAAGAKLHFDDESYNGDLTVPRQDSWKIIELPSMASSETEAVSRGASLADSHALDDVRLSIRYLDLAGVEQTYAGPESEFDWSNVKSVEAEERHPQYPEPLDPSEAPDVSSGTDDSAGAKRDYSELWDALRSYAEKIAEKRNG